MSLLSRKTARRAAVTVEFAFVFPVFLIFLFAGVEMARLNMLRHAADNAAYESARYGIVPGATVAEVEQKAHEYLGSVKVTNGNITVNPDPITEDTVDLTVTVSVPLDGNAWISPQFMSEAAIQATSTLRAERYRGIQSITP